MDGYIYKNPLTINETVEVWIIKFDDRSEWFGSQKELTELLQTSEWKAGDYVTDTGEAYVLA